MDHIAIDLGATSSQFCHRDDSGQILGEGKIPTAQLKAKFQGTKPCRVVLEGCAEAFTVADLATAAGHEVVVVPATLSPVLGVGHRGIKTDQRDAQALSRASCQVDLLPSVHVPRPQIRDLRAQLTARNQLVKVRTSLINSVRGLMRAQLTRPASGVANTFADRARKAMLSTPQGVPQYVEDQLEMIERLTEKIDAASNELKIRARNTVVCQRLMTVPGVGVLTALQFAAALDEVDRFSSAHSVQSYLGLTPGERSSGGTRRMTGITKAGNAQARWHLVQAAWSYWRTQPNDPAVQWAMRIAERRGRKVAIVALARKLAGILFAFWRDDSSYNAKRSARSTTAI